MIVVNNLKINKILSIISTLVLKDCINECKTFETLPEKIAIISELLFFLLCSRF